MAQRYGHSIGRYNGTTGAAVDSSFISGLADVVGVSVYGSTIYVSDPNDGSPSNSAVHKYSTSGALIDASFITGPTAPVNAQQVLVSSVGGIPGTFGDDSLRGTAGNDTFDAGTGNDTIIGNGGSDTVILGGTRAQANLIPNADGSWEISTPGGTDHLVGIAHVQFDDITYDLYFPLPTAGSDHVVRVIADANLIDASFAGAHNLTAVYLNGTGAQYVTLGANAEAAFTNHAIKLRALHASNFTVDTTGLSASAKADIFADSGTAHFTGGVENDTFYFFQATWNAAGRTVEGGGGFNNIDLYFNGSIADADFIGLHHLNEIDLGGSNQASFTLGANAVAAFTGTIKVAAINSAVISVDGHALAQGYLGVGGAGADSFIGGAGNDSFYGKADADLFILGQGGHDRIYDFAHGQDHIDLTAAGVHNLAGISMRESGTEAVLTYAGQELRLNNMDYHALTASDFIFA